MDAPEQFCFHIKDFECDFWKKPLEKSEDILATCILLLNIYIPSCSSDSSKTGNQVSKIQSHAYSRMQKNKIILYLGEYFPQHLQKSYSWEEKKNSMHDFGLQESESHLAFKLCNFLTDD